MPSAIQFMLTCDLPMTHNNAVEELRTEIANVESQERSIRDNIQFRTQAKDLANMKQRIREKEVR